MRTPDVSEADEQRYWAKVDVRGENECWPWMAGRKPFGHGTFYLGGTQVLAHRVSYLLENGAWPVPMGTHDCDNPWCQNPRHIREGTQASNLRGMAERGRSTLGERHHNARLTERQVQIIRLLCERIGLSRSEVARRYGMSREQVRDIMSRKRWRHVPSLEI